MDEIIRRLVSQRQRLVGEERKLCDTGVSIAKYQDREELINLLDDVLELLKAQQPRVLTLEEVKLLPEESDVFVEFHSLNGWEIAAMTIRAAYDDGILFYMTSSRNRFDQYGKFGGSWRAWRCWSARPTDAEREAAKWDD